MFDQLSLLVCDSFCGWTEVAVQRHETLACRRRTGSRVLQFVLGRVTHRAGYKLRRAWRVWFWLSAEICVRAVPSIWRRRERASSIIHMAELQYYIEFPYPIRALNCYISYKHVILPHMNKRKRGGFKIGDLFYLDSFFVTVGCIVEETKCGIHYLVKSALANLNWRYQRDLMALIRLQIYLRFDSKNGNWGRIWKGVEQRLNIVNWRVVGVLAVSTFRTGLFRRMFWSTVWLYFNCIQGKWIVYYNW